MVRRGLALAPLLFLFGCTHGLDFSGEGFIFALNDPQRNCSSATAPCTFTIQEAYRENYLAVPASGQRFVGWDRCGNEQSSMCSFNVPANVVAQYEGRTFANAVAQFESIASRSFEGAFDGVYSASNENHPVRCLAVPAGRLACRVRRASDGSLLSMIDLNIQLSPAGSGNIGPNGWNISGGTGSEYWEPDDFFAYDIPAVSGSYRGRQNMVFEFESGGVEVVIQLNEYLAFYDVTLPLRFFAEAIPVPFSANPEVTHSFDAEGNYQVDFSDCELDVQMQLIGGGLNTYSIAAQSTCANLGDSFTGFGFSKLDPENGFLDHEMLMFPEGSGIPLWYRPEGDIAPIPGLAL